MGFKVIVGGSVHEARDLDDAAVHVLAAREFGQSCRVRKCTSLTDYRDLTYDEQAELVERASALACR